jgi:uncharacterized membrane protein YbhN (UPF0104 family)
MRTRTYRAISGFAGICSLAAVCYLAFRSQDAIKQIPWTSGKLLAAFLASSFLSTLIYPASAAAFFVILRQLGNHPHYWQQLDIICKTQLSRYLPGNFAQHLFRAALLSRIGIPLGAIAAALMLETLLNLAAGVATFVMSSGGVLPEVAAPQMPIHTWAALASLTVIIIVTITFLQRTTLLAAANKACAMLCRIRPTGMLLGMALYSTSFAVTGCGLWLICNAMGYSPPKLIELVGIFAVAWAGGAAAPGMPAGLGVREAVLVVMLSSAMSPEHAALLAATHRLSTMAGDVLVACAARWR